MAVNYDDTLDTDRDKVRFHLGDTKQGEGPRPTDANYSDAEIDALVTSTGSWQKCVATLLDALAIEWSRYSVIWVGPRKEEFDKVSVAYAERAKKWRADYGIRTATTAGTKTVTRKDGYSDDKDNVTQ